MKVVLLADVKAQGKKDQIVEVSEGYARNFLFPKKLAVPADAKAVNDVKSRESSNQYRIDVEKAEATALAKKLDTLTVTLTESASADGKFYGSITTKDIAGALKEQHGIEIDKRKVECDVAIKGFGTYKVNVKCYTEIYGKLTVVVTEK